MSNTTKKWWKRSCYSNSVSVQTSEPECFERRSHTVLWGTALNGERPNAGYWKWSPPMSDRQTVVTAFAESCSGPGWANNPVWVVLKDGDGKLSLDAIQPENQTDTMCALYGVSQAAHLAMTKACRHTFEGG